MSALLNEGANPAASVSSASNWTPNLDTPRSVTLRSEAPGHGLSVDKQGGEVDRADRATVAVIPRVASAHSRRGCATTRPGRCRRRDRSSCRRPWPNPGPSVQSVQLYSLSSPSSPLRRPRKCDTRDATAHTARFASCPANCLRTAQPCRPRAAAMHR
jgi:hypothetical protein